MHSSGDAGQRLDGGNVADSVVRVGGTVRKPWTRASPAVAALLGHLAAAGFAGSPRSLGRDEAGRHVLEFVPGQLAGELPPMSVQELRRLGSLVREFHEIVSSFEPPPRATWELAVPPDREELICHNDLAPWNLVRDGDRWVFIDWAGAGPGSRLWDLAYAARSFVPLQSGGTPQADAVRLRALVDGYRLSEDERSLFPALMVERTWAMYDLLRSGREPWARLLAEGHGEYWRGAAEYVESFSATWSASLVS
jgi:Ser/Thr protein kinase RdoA (MazF antagonist)